MSYDNYTDMARHILLTRKWAHKALSCAYDEMLANGDESSIVLYESILSTLKAINEAERVRYESEMRKRDTDAGRLCNA